MKDKLPPVHPGKMIEDGIDHLGLSQKDFAAVLGVSPQYICDIIKGRKSLTVDICVKLPEVIGSTAEMWMRLQQRYDLKIAETNAALQKARVEIRQRLQKYNAATKAATKAAGKSRKKRFA